jgi:tetratricopeptide (TPR) repeat protein
MNWKIVGIVTVAIFCLIGIGGVIYGGIKIVQSIPAGESMVQCLSADPDVSIAGCTAMLQSGSLDDGQRLTAYLRHSLAYEHKGDFDHAIEDDTHVIQLNPKEAIAYNNRGFHYQCKGDFDHAIADYSQAIQIFPEMSLAWFNRSEAYHLKGNDPQAIDDLGRVIHFQPKNAVAWNNRCYYRAIVGELDAALEDCNRSLQLQPGIGATLDSRGFTYLKMKKYDLAIVDYDAAIAKNSKQASWLYGRGVAERGKHDEAKAAADIAAAAKIEPGVAERFKTLGVS